ncbi:GntR family transcriptional regulator [Yoonia sp.]|uniref:GntR family transcriptional regulator n=1 Tax=Yoonia sp. TaxID=2212373 RepID=UPI00391A1C71
MSTSPPSRNRISPRLAADIAALIESESLPKGAHLRTADLARRFAVSRWPVEQALRELAKTGRIRHAPNRGFFVCQDAAATPEPPLDPVHIAYLKLARLLVAQTIGQQITEQEIRDRFALTKRQTADLMGRLIREGIAEKRAGYGWNINTDLTAPDALAHTTQMRLILEPAALRLPSYHLPAEVIARLRRVEYDLLDGTIDRVPPDTLYLHGAEFHEMVMTGARNPFMLQALVRVNRVRRLLSYSAMDDRNRYYRQAREHLQILDLIEAGDHEAAAHQMETHLRKVRHSLSALGLIPAQDMTSAGTSC